jgi:ABC-2 type transport system permease protein
VRALAAAFRFQLATSRRDYGQLMPLFTAPLMTVIFLAIAQQAGRDDLTGHAVLAPALIALWGTSLMVAGEIIDNERWAGTLEGVIATPTPLGVVVLGRVLAVMIVGCLGFVESWLVAALLFDVVVPIPHPGWFIATLAVTVFAMAGTATIMAAVFVLARTARTFQNTLSYPVYVLGGVLVPVELLPAWVQPLARVVFLSWASDLFRDSLTAVPVDRPLARLAVVAVLGALGFAAGRWALRRILEKVRVTGSLVQA